MTHSKATPINAQQGFALVATISVLVLLVMVAIAMLSLSTIELRASRHLSFEEEAKANARLALMIALGELQENLGPDKRISATSDIFDTDPTTAEIDGVTRRHLMGVWDSWKWQPNGGGINYDQEKEGSFRKWMISSPDSGEADLINTPIANDEILLLGEGSCGGEITDYVSAPLISLVDSNSRVNGGYSWVAFDEGVKASTFIADTDSSSEALKMQRLSAPVNLGFGALAEWENITGSNSESGKKLVSHKTLALLGIDPEAKSNYHSLSPYSKNLVTDVVDGGLSKDLSLLLDHQALPAEYQNKYLYSATDTPIAEVPKRFEGASPMPSPDPSWKLLQSHFQLCSKVEKNGNGKLQVQASSEERPLTQAEAPGSPFFNEQQLLPVISKAQFVYSFSSHPGSWRFRAFWQPLGIIDPEDQHGLVLVTDPIVTLWNPYNVALTFKRAEIQLFRVPLTYRLYYDKKGAGSLTLVNREYAHLAHQTGGQGWRSRHKPHTLKLEGKEVNGTVEDITINPGEHLVFSSVEPIWQYNASYYNPGYTLRPGFVPPSDVPNVEGVGGAMSQVVLNDENRAPMIGNYPMGQSTGWGAMPMRKNDKIWIEVKAAKAGVSSDPPPFLAQTNDKEIASFMKFVIYDSGNNPKLVGGVELDYTSSQMSKNLPDIAKEDLPSYTPSPELIARGAGSTASVFYKRPFLIASLNLKTEEDSEDPSKSWIHNSPINTYASSGVDQLESPAAHQYELTWKPMTGWVDVPGIQLDTQNRGYGGSGLYSDSGQKVTPFAQIPLVAPISMAELRHAPLNTGGKLPLTTQIVANSFACPLLERTSALTNGALGGYLDHSFLANNSLFDHYFFSSASSQNTQFHVKAKDSGAVLNDFFTHKSDLPNPRFTPVLTGITDIDALSDRLSSDDGYKEMASHLYLNGAFNVNSTNLNAWRVFLASGIKESLPVLNVLSSTYTGEKSIDKNLIISRFQPPLSETSIYGQRDSATARWYGYRGVSIDDDKIDRLAEAAVEQVKRRGPFQSISEFVNRRLENSDLGLNGALQAAIEESNLNDAEQAFGVEITSSIAGGHGYADSDAAIGKTSDGTPSKINQADLLAPLAPFIVVRSDTFRIRAYGESKNAETGEVLARVWCEAVVQREVNYIDGKTPSATPFADLKPDGENAKFGRRMRVVDFKWLNHNEI